ncbi:MAG: tyrosine-protein phosphatase [Pseudomonadota bacterium]
MRLFKAIVDWERRVRAYYNTDLTSPENRRRAHIYNMWFDHAALRVFWTNFFEVAPGVFRSNQPTHRRFERLKARGFRTVLNLRGRSDAAHFLTEEESCAQLGLELVNVNMLARHAPAGQDVLAMIDAFRTIERPFVMHCKSGADRAGFASAVYLMVIEGRSILEARKMLSPKYLHFRFTTTGVLDHILDLYEARNAREPIGFEDWVQKEYDAVAVQADYAAHYKPWF